MVALSTTTFKTKFTEMFADPTVLSTDALGLTEVFVRLAVSVGTFGWWFLNRQLSKRMTHMITGDESDWEPNSKETVAQS